MELDYKAIGKRIKIARIKADLTQERLAELIDISPTHLSNIETGTTRVSLNTIISIANALSVTGDDLLCDNNSIIKHPPYIAKDYSCGNRLCKGAFFMYAPIGTVPIGAGDELIAPDLQLFAWAVPHPHREPHRSAFCLSHPY